MGVMTDPVKTARAALDKANKEYEQAKFDAEQALSRRELAWHRACGECELTVRR